VIPHAIVTTCIIPAYTIRTLGMRVSEYVAKAYMRPLLCAGPVAALCWLLSIRIERPSWIVFALEGAAISAGFAILAYFICLTATQQRLVQERVRGVIQREPVANEA